MSKHHLIEIDLTKSTERIQSDINQAFRSASEAFIQALRVGFRLNQLSLALGIKPGASKDGEGFDWGSYLEALQLASPRTLRRWMTYATQAAKLRPELESFLERAIEDHSAKEKKVLESRLTELAEKHSLNSLHCAELTPGTNNPEGKNGQDKVPDSPEQKQEQLTFEAISTWGFLADDPYKPKGGTIAYRLMAEAGLVSDPDGQPLKTTFEHLPQESQTQIREACQILLDRLK